MRTMRLLSAGVALALALVLGLAAGPRAHAGGARQCPNRHGHVMLANREAEVYVRRQGEGPHGGLQPKEIVGCAYAKGRVYEFGPPPCPRCVEPEAEVRSVIVVGHFVAYEFYGPAENLPLPEPQGGSQEVLVVDLLNGRVVHREPTGPALEPGGTGRGPARTIVLKRNGSVAWINSFNTSPGEFEVHIADRRGRRAAASGPTIEPLSLRLRGNRIYWSQAGHTMSAPLD